MKIVVIGGGVTGRIAKYFFPEAKVLESREEIVEKNLTNNFGANYLWKPLEGFECKKYEVLTRINDQLPTSESILEYKKKVGKESENLEDLMEQFKARSDGWIITKYPETEIQYGYKVSGINLRNKSLVKIDTRTGIESLEFYDFLFSTIPLKTLMELSGLKHIELEKKFRYKPIYVSVDPDYIHPRLNPGIIYVNYISDPNIKPYRFSIRDGVRQIESLEPTEGWKVIYPGKIYDFPESKNIVQHFKDYDVFCLGRFGKWESDELVHKTYEQVEKMTGVIK